MIKKREFKESNYRGLWFKGKTIRIALDPSKPITELKYPEFYDVDVFGTEIDINGKLIGGLCNGKCSYCYLSAQVGGTYVKDAVKKIKDYFGPMTENQRPFQVALPGSGEFTMHPDWIEILKTFKDLGIEPNYTTNGMWVDLNSSGGIPTEEEQKVLDATKKYCGGIAVSCHPHLFEYWTVATNFYHQAGIKTNLHIIISDKESIDDFKIIYDNFKDKVDYFVLLPYGNQGRAKHKDIDWEYLITQLPEDQSQLAFGANFYPYLIKGNHGIKIYLYEPEILSKFLDLKDMKLYNSSFSINE